MKTDYGVGIYLYFQWVWYLVMFNAVLCVPAIVTQIAGASEGLDTNTYPGLGSLFLGAFPASVRTLWYAMTSIGAVLGLASPWVYRWYQGRIESAWKGADRVEELTEGEDIIEENRDVTSSERRRRRTVTVLSFLAILVVQGILTYYLQLALVNASGATVGQVLSATLAILNMVWKKVSKFMTKYEKHRTMREYTEWDTSKVFVLKIGSVLALYITKSLVGADSVDADTCRNDLNAVDCGCPLEQMGQQFFWLIIIELVIGNITELGIPALRVWFRSRKSASSGKGDEDLKEKFDLAEEFTELFYRQFVILLGTTVFPLVTVLGLVSLYLEFWLDKLRLLKYCTKPLIKPDPVRTQLVFGCNLAVAVIFLFSYPNGMVMIFAGLNMGDCSFFK